MKRLRVLIIALSAIGLSAACALAPTARLTHAAVLPGIDVLKGQAFAPLRGLRVGLITNHTGVDAEGRATIDLLFQAPGVKLVSLFSPEHGIRGTEDTGVDSGIDEKTGLPIHSLYGKIIKPTPAMLSGLDALVFDIQDIGTRYYTYIGTLSLAMRAARENGKKIFVLDRPNPIGGVRVEGAVPDADQCSGLTCIHPIPTRHGMTVGELARLFNDHFGIHADLEVIPMSGWRRSMFWDDTGLRWINPSPNMKTLNGAILYPGPGSLEDTKISVGRGLATPFEMYGAPSFNSETILALLSKRNIRGVRFEPVSFTPTAKYHQFEGQLCHGIRVVITDREELDPVLLGLHLLQVFQRSAPKTYLPNPGFVSEIGDARVWDELTRQGRSPEAVLERWQGRVTEFRKVRERFLIY